ncbi:hypothetical protein QUF72_06345 [Desulfobacterales bacterium HSG2]|nr:hypothetical protein [Desulfobacterales bacterium HSG2]
MSNNIVLNACDAFEVLKDDRERVLELTLTESDRTQIVSVRDNANGISENDRTGEICQQICQEGV